jgi:hypothetical protein
MAVILHRKVRIRWPHRCRAMEKWGIIIQVLQRFNIGMPVSQMVWITRNCYMGVKCWEVATLEQRASETSGKEAVQVVVVK